MLEITIIMPALNEARNLTGAVENVIRSFERLGVNGEVLIVNDGSTDDSEQVIDALKARHPNIRSLRHATPQGIGASFWDGVQNARGDVVVMVPGDGENDCYEILRYLPLMKQVDIVVPFVYNVQTRTFARRMVSKLYKSIINLSFGLLLNYMNGTVMYRRSVLRTLELRSNGFFYQTELLIKSIKLGYLYAEVPYALSQRGSGKSKALTFTSFLKVSRNYLSALKAVYGTQQFKRRELAKDCVTCARSLELKEAPSGEENPKPLAPQQLV